MGEREDEDSKSDEGKRLHSAKLRAGIWRFLFTLELKLTDAE